MSAVVQRWASTTARLDLVCCLLVLALLLCFALFRFFTPHFRQSLMSSIRLLESKECLGQLVPRGQPGQTARDGMPWFKARGCSVNTNGPAAPCRPNGVAYAVSNAR